MNKRRRIVALISIAFALLIMASSPYQIKIISPLVIMATARPTPHGDTPTPSHYMPAIMRNYSPLPTPTARPTP